MTRGKKGTPEKEQEEAAERIKQHKEAVRAARDSSTWHRFLTDVLTITPIHYETDRGDAFWEAVREKIYSEETETYTGIRQVQARDSEGHFTKEFTNERYYYIMTRNIHTKKLTNYEIKKI